jgi:hypothetical protein
MSKQFSEELVPFDARPAGPMPPKPKAISIRDLQKMSAGAIQALEGPTPVKSGTAVVAILSPVRPTSPDRAAAWRDLGAQLAESRRNWTADEKATARRILEERGIFDE